jgi:hypothetical protein
MKAEEKEETLECTTVSVYMPIAIAEKLERRARREERSLSQMAARLLREALKDDKA